MAGNFTEKMLIDLYEDGARDKRFKKAQLRQIEAFKEAVFSRLLDHALAEFDARTSNTKKLPKYLKVDLPLFVIKPEEAKVDKNKTVDIVTPFGTLPCN